MAALRVCPSLRLSVAFGFLLAKTKCLQKTTVDMNVFQGRQE